MINRRKFIGLTGALGSGLLLQRAAGALLEKRAHPFGLQLYTLRDVLPQDPKGILRQVAAAGYTQVESFEGSQGMFWGMTPTGIKSFLSGLGMDLVSSHCTIDEDFERKAAQAAEAGMRYLICPWLGPQKKIDDFKHHAARFNECGSICRREGLRFAYHNHDYGFVPLEGQLPQDVLLHETDKELVDFEMDLYWVVTAGQDPVAWLNRYPGRFRLCHVKDRSKDAPPTQREAFVNLGQGRIDFPKILKTAKKQVQYYFVEQEAYPGTTPVEAMRADGAYMKKLMAHEKL